MTNEVIKEILRLNGFRLVYAFVEEQEPFRLVILNNNNWDKPLPDYILENHPDFLSLDIKENELVNSYTEDGEIYISVYFGEELYNKKLYKEEIYVISNFDDHPYHINEVQDFLFNEENLKEIVEEKIQPLEIISAISASERIPPEIVKNSLFKMLNKNPLYASKFDL